MIVDDLGYGDLGLYGNTTIRSPNIDALGAMGVRFTQHYAPAPICTPSRSGTLTGRYPVRMGMTNADERFRTLNSPAQPGGIPPEEVTFAEEAQRRGYRTAMVGKWHLGLGAHNEHLPTRNGFDSYFGMPVTNVQTCPTCESDVAAPHGEAPAAPGCKGGKRVYDLVGGRGETVTRPFLHFFVSTTRTVWTAVAVGIVTLAAVTRSPRATAAAVAVAATLFAAVAWYTATFTLLSEPSCLLYENETVLEQPLRLQNLTERNTRRAVDFIERSEEARRADGRPWLLYLAYVKVHTALFTAPARVGRSGHGAYGDNLEELDWSVGEVVAALQRTGALRNTLLYFTSDNGPFLERGSDAGFCGRATDLDGAFHGPLKGAKGQTWECGVRVPGLFVWPDRIPAGRVSRRVTSSLDLFPTLMSAMGPVPPASGSERQKLRLDGIDLLPYLSLAHADDPWAEGHQHGAEMPGVGASTKDSALVDPDRPFLFHYCGSTVTAVRHGRYKAHFHSPRWDDGLFACPSRNICPCADVTHDPPLLFDIELDPAEVAPLDARTHADVLARIAAAKAEHEAGVEPVPNQLSALGRPWLYPCCNPGGRRSAWQQAWRIATGTCTCDE